MSEWRCAVWTGGNGANGGGINPLFPPLPPVEFGGCAVSHRRRGFLFAGFSVMFLAPWWGLPSPRFGRIRSELFESMNLGLPYQITGANAGQSQRLTAGSRGLSRVIGPAWLERYVA